MTVAERTRREVARRIARIEAEYGEFPVEEATATNDPEFFEHGRSMAADGWIGDAGALVTDARERVLLIRHRGAPETWGTPGGGHVPGETLAETARREVREETGIDASVTGVCWARRTEVRNEADPDECFFMLTVEFEARAETTAGDAGIDVGDEEVLAARWFAEPPGEVADHVEEFFADRDGG